MNRKYLYALLAWILMGIVANVNGIIRNSLVEPVIGEHGGHVLSTAIFICAILVITYWYVSKMGPDWTRRQLLAVGAAWLVMTIIFEFVFGHYVVGHTWERLMADYNLLNGRVWSLVLVTTFFAPIAIGMKTRMVRAG